MDNVADKLRALEVDGEAVTGKYRRKMWDGLFGVREIDPPALNTERSRELWHEDAKAVLAETHPKHVGKFKELGDHEKRVDFIRKLRE